MSDEAAKEKTGLEGRGASQYLPHRRAFSNPLRSGMKAGKAGRGRLKNVLIS
ncbi:MAG: hypothetical protein ABIJ57_06195 [Pseudomonadota bacterium]